MNVGQNSRFASLIRRKSCSTLPKTYPGYVYSSMEHTLRSFWHQCAEGLIFEIKKMPNSREINLQGNFFNTLKPVFTKYLIRSQKGYF